MARAVNLTEAIRQKCIACVHFAPQEGTMGFCAIHRELRPERYWCDRWTPRTVGRLGRKDAATK